MARLPEKLSKQKALRERVRQAMKELPGKERPNRYKRPPRINLTDKDARLMRTRQGIVPSYNAQAMVSPVAADGGVTGMLVTASDVVDEPNDAARLTAMTRQAEEVSGTRAPMTLADAGYFAGRHVAELHQRGQQVVMPDMARPTDHLYHKDQFIYDEETDSYTCPHGEVLAFTGMKNNKTKKAREYRIVSASVCRECPAFGVCTRNISGGRSLEIGPYDVALRRHSDRRSPTSLSTPAASGRATLCDHQESARSATILAAGSGRRQGRVGHARHHIQHEDSLACVANRDRHQLESCMRVD